MASETDRALRLCGALGVVSLLSYAAAVLFSPLAYPGYDWMSQAVSDLSALDAPSRELWGQLACLHAPCGIACCTAAAIYAGKSSDKDRLLVVGIFLFALMNWLSAVGYALFPLPEAGKGIQGFQAFMHVYVVTPGVVLLSIASLACIGIAGLKDTRHRTLGLCAFLALIAMFAGAIGSFAVPERFFGVAERLSVFAPVLFNAVLGIHLASGRL